MAKKKVSDSPLFLHRNGQYCKKIKAKAYYFGSDEATALKRWAEEKDFLLAGLPVPRNDPSPTLQELGNLFVDRCRKRVSEGELSQVSLDDYERTIRRMIAFLGNKYRPEKMAPQDYAALKERFSEPVIRTTPIRGGVKGRSVARRSPVTVSGDVRCVRAFLTWAYKSELIATAPRFGTDFSPASAKVVRQQRKATGRRDLQPSHIRAVVANSSVLFRPLILMAINGGIGNLDLSEIRLGTIQLSGNETWVDLPRNKTGAPRRFVLWPETIAAIRAYHAVRPSPAGSANINRFFLTRSGLAWIRGIGNDKQDAIGGAFLKARRTAGVERGAFYDLRRTFATVAAETMDFPAVQYVMGHASASNDMAAIYTQAISDERIRNVCAHVRAWLFGAEVAQ